MAKAEIQMPEDFLRRLSLLGDKSDEIAESVLEAGGEVMVSSIKSKLASVRRIVSSFCTSFSYAPVSVPS